MSLNYVQAFLRSVILFFLDQLIAFVASGDPNWRGYVIALGMAICALLESMLNGQYEFWINVTSMRMRAALIASIYRKVSLPSF